MIGVGLHEVDPISSTPKGIDPTKDIGNPAPSDYVRTLADKLTRIAEELHEFNIGNGAQEIVAKAKKWLSDIDHRNIAAGKNADLFVEPAWPMMLDLYVARVEVRSISVSSLCYAGRCPPTTALRHITMLTERGLIERVPDPADRRRVNLRLTDAGTGLCENWLTRR